MTNQRFFSIFKHNIFLIKILANAALFFEFTNELPIQDVPRIELVDLLMVVIFCIMSKEYIFKRWKGTSISIIYCWLWSMSDAYIYRTRIAYCRSSWYTTSLITKFRKYFSLEHISIPLRSQQEDWRGIPWSFLSTFNLFLKQLLKEIWYLIEDVIMVMQQLSFCHGGRHVDGRLWVRSPAKEIHLSYKLHHNRNSYITSCVKNVERINVELRFRPWLAIYESRHNFILFSASSLIILPRI